MLNQSVLRQLLTCCFKSTEYEAQSADLEKELQDALTSRKELESTNEGMQRKVAFSTAEEIREIDKCIGLMTRICASQNFSCFFLVSGKKLMFTLLSLFSPLSRVNEYGKLSENKGDAW